MLDLFLMHLGLFFALAGGRLVTNAPGRRGLARAADTSKQRIGQSETRGIACSRVRFVWFAAWRWLSLWRIRFDLMHSDLHKGTVPASVRP